MSTDRTAKIRETLIYVLILNWAVALAKIIFGYWTKSNSMSADGFHSFSDGSSNIVGLVGIWFASQPIDKEHPYGHKKYETFYSLTIAILLFMVSVAVIHTAIERFKNPVIPDVNFYSFIVMAVTIGINFAVMFYEYGVGRKLNSDILISDSLHTRADILTSFSVITALVAVKVGYPLIDPIASLIIAGFISYAAFDILRQGSRVLCDTAVIDTTEIEKLVKSIEGVKTCHKIRTRGRIDDIFIDLHVLVKNDMHMDKAHDLSSRIEEAIKKRFPGVADVTVHLEPITSIGKRKT
jgi:cation diffusion facilitator family transporter